MYFQLGDITFQGMIGFESFTDNDEAVYAQHDLIGTKPKLQRTGDALKEISGTISFHSSFCIPEDEYFKLIAKKVSGEPLSLIYGNGRYEGDYIIKGVSRQPNQTTPNGDYIHLTCTVSLIESDSTLSPSQRQEQAKSTAFALTSNRPLPVGADIKDVNNPALSVMNENKNASQNAGKLSDFNEKLDARIKTITDPTNVLIAQAKEYVQVSPDVTTHLNRYINNIGRSLNAITTLLSANPLMSSISPDLNNQVNTAKAVLLNAESVASDIASLPPVNTTADAIYVLNVQKNAILSAKQLVEQLATMNSAAAGLAGAIAAKKKVTT